MVVRHAEAVDCERGEELNGQCRRKEATKADLVGLKSRDEVEAGLGRGLLVDTGSDAGDDGRDVSLVETEDETIPSMSAGEEGVKWNVDDVKGLRQIGAGVAKDLRGLGLDRVGVGRVVGVDKGGDIRIGGKGMTMGETEIIVRREELRGQKGLNDDRLPGEDPCEKGGHPARKGFSVSGADLGDVSELEGDGEAGEGSGDGVVGKVDETRGSKFLVDGKGVGEASGGRGDFDGSEMVLKSRLELADGDLEGGAVCAVGVAGDMGKLMGEIDVVVKEPVAVDSELTKLGVELVVGNGQGGNVGNQVD